LSCLSFLVAVSMHIGLDNNYNSIHPHMRCTIDNNISGIYYNSENNISFYIGKSVDIKLLKLEYGIVSGYSENNILPMIRFKKDTFFIAPAYERTGNVGVVLGWEYKL